VVIETVVVVEVVADEKGNKRAALVKGIKP